MAIKDFEHYDFKIDKESRSLKYEIELKNSENGSLKYLGVIKKINILYNLQFYVK